MLCGRDGGHSCIVELVVVVMVMVFYGCDGGIVLVVMVTAAVRVFVISKYLFNCIFCGGIHCIGSCSGVIGFVVVLLLLTTSIPTTTTTTTNTTTTTTTTTTTFKTSFTTSFTTHHTPNYGTSDDGKISDIVGL